MVTAIPNGYAYRSPVYQRAMRLVVNITNAFPAEVTTSFDHEYETGDIVRLIVPRGWGMIQADKALGIITVTGSTTFTIDIDTILFDVFTIPPDPSYHIISVAQVVPVGQINDKLSSATMNVL